MQQQQAAVHWAGLNSKQRGKSHRKAAYRERRARREAQRQLAQQRCVLWGALKAAKRRMRKRHSNSKPGQSPSPQTSEQHSKQYGKQRGEYHNKQRCKQRGKQRNRQRCKQYGKQYDRQYGRQHSKQFGKQQQQLPAVPPLPARTLSAAAAANGQLQQEPPAQQPSAAGADTAPAATANGAAVSAVVVLMAVVLLLASAAATAICAHSRRQQATGGLPEQHGVATCAVAGAVVVIMAVLLLLASNKQHRRRQQTVSLPVARDGYNSSHTACADYSLVKQTPRVVVPSKQQQQLPAVPPLPARTLSAAAAANGQLQQEPPHTTAAASLEGVHAGQQRCCCDTEQDAHISVQQTDGLRTAVLGTLTATTQGEVAAAQHPIRHSTVAHQAQPHVDSSPIGACDSPHAPGTATNTVSDLTQEPARKTSTSRMVVKCSVRRILLDSDVRLSTGRTSVVQLRPLEAVEQLVQCLNKGFMEARLWAAMLLSHAAAAQYGHANGVPGQPTSPESLLGAVFAQDPESTSADRMGRQMLMQCARQVLHAPRDTGRGQGTDTVPTANKALFAHWYVPCTGRNAVWQGHALPDWVDTKTMRDLMDTVVTMWSVNLQQHLGNVRERADHLWQLLLETAYAAQGMSLSGKQNKKKRELLQDSISQLVWGSDEAVWGSALPDTLRMAAGLTTTAAMPDNTVAEWQALQVIVGVIREVRLDLEKLRPGLSSPQSHLQWMRASFGRTDDTSNPVPGHATTAGGPVQAPGGVPSSNTATAVADAIHGVHGGAFDGHNPVTTAAAAAAGFTMAGTPSAAAAVATGFPYGMGVTGFSIGGMQAATAAGDFIATAAAAAAAAAGGGPRGPSSGVASNNPTQPVCTRRELAEHQLLWQYLVLHHQELLSKEFKATKAATGQRQDARTTAVLLQRIALHSTQLADEQTSPSQAYAQCSGLIRDMDKLIDKLRLTLLPEGVCRNQQATHPNLLTSLLRRQHDEQRAKVASLQESCQQAAKQRAENSVNNPGQGDSLRQQLRQLQNSDLAEDDTRSPEAKAQLLCHQDSRSHERLRRQQRRTKALERQQHKQQSMSNSLQQQSHLDGTVHDQLTQQLDVVRQHLPVWQGHLQTAIKGMLAAEAQWQLAAALMESARFHVQQQRHEVLRDHTLSQLHQWHANAVGTQLTGVNGALFVSIRHAEDAVRRGMAMGNECGGYMRHTAWSTSADGMLQRLHAQQLQISQSGLTLHTAGSCLQQVSSALAEAWQFVVGSGLSQCLALLNALRAKADAELHGMVKPTPKLPRHFAKVWAKVFKQLGHGAGARQMCSKHVSKWAFTLCPMPGFGMEHIHLTNTVMTRLGWLSYCTSRAQQSRNRKKGEQQVAYPQHGALVPGDMNKTAFTSWVLENGRGWDLWFDLEKIRGLVPRDRRLAFAGHITTDGVTACVHFDRQSDVPDSECITQKRGGKGGKRAARRAADKARFEKARACLLEHVNTILPLLPPGGVGLSESDSEGEMTDSEGEVADAEGEVTDSEGGVSDSEGEMTDSEGEVVTPAWFIKPCDMQLDTLFCVNDSGTVVQPVPIHDTLRIVGIDPGSGTHLFTAVDALHGRSGSQSHGAHCIKVAANQYRSACGMTKHAAWYRGMLRRSGFAQLESQVHQVRGVANVAELALHASHKVCLLDRGKELHGSFTARQWALRVHCLQRRQFHRMAQLFTRGVTTVRGKWLTEQPRRIPDVAKPSMCVVGLGNASVGWNSPISRKHTAPVVSFYDFMQREYAARDDHVWVVHVDEYRTSQVCSRCWLHVKRRGVDGMKQMAVGPKDGDKSPCWKLKKCVSGQGCCRNLVVDRDVNAARNMTAVLLQHLFEGHVDEEQQQQLNACFLRPSI
jgi:hypothetical protein